MKEEDFIFEYRVGDCLELFKEVEDDSFSMIFADPPYNKGKDYYSVSDDRDDYFEWMEKWMEECYRVLRPGGSAYFINSPENFGRQERAVEKVGFEIVNYIIWMRRNPAPVQNRFPNIHQDIHYCYKPGGERYFSIEEEIPYELRREDGIVGEDHRPYDVWIDIPKLVPGFMAQDEVVLEEEDNSMVLPNQLPEKLVKRCVLASTRKEEKILDPFLGVGTTMRVAGKTERQFLGFEINKEYEPILSEQKEELLPITEKGAEKKQKQPEQIKLSEDVS